NHQPRFIANDKFIATLLPGTVKPAPVTVGIQCGENTLLVQIVCEKLSRERACVGWRREVLSQLVSEWGWDDARLTMLDNRANWK
ncbi:class I adenylate cyclase, partial [Salmonella enterica subsp. enterica serovar Anatum]|nr:class I adenylate cyclase [Salmonella enterica subsp. enterica serovar Anatum]